MASEHGIDLSTWQAPARWRISKQDIEAVIAAPEPQLQLRQRTLPPFPRRLAANTSTFLPARHRAGSLRRPAHVALETAVLREKCISAITKCSP